MNKVVTKDVLAADLPRTVRGDIDPRRTVRVTVEELPAGEAPPREAGHFSRHFAIRRGTFGSMDEVVAHIRSVRDGDG